MEEEKPKEEKIVEEEDSELKKATAFKNEGNEFYKKKEFDEALKCYNKAIETYPKEILFYSNKCACLTEMKDFEAALKVLEEGVEIYYQLLNGLNIKK